MGDPSVFGAPAPNGDRLAEAPWLPELERFLIRTLPRGTSPPDGREVAFATARLVDAAARRSPTRPNCLARSIVLWALLRVQGVASDLRFGFRRNGGEFVGHAWVVRLGLPINDVGDVADVYEVVDFPPT